MAAIVSGAVVLSWTGTIAVHSPWPPLAILAACLCWGIDNNLTRKVSLSDTISFSLVFAGGLMAFGVWLHITENHAHEHKHAAVEHTHAHVHDDEHHRHDHETYPDGSHIHRHRHEPVRHTHSHYPDEHHRHAH